MYEIDALRNLRKDVFYKFGVRYYSMLIVSFVCSNARHRSASRILANLRKADRECF